VDYIVESLLEPSKKIKEGYATTLLTLKNNDVVVGFLSAQSESQLTMRDATGKITQVPKHQIAKQDSVPVSLMPPGLTASLRHDEFVDLVRFLSELGKEGDYKIKRETTIRRWRVLNYDKALDGPMNRDGWRALGQPHSEFPWTPAYTLVDGQLPAADVPKLKVFVHSMSAAQCEIEVTTPGQIGLRLNDATAMHLFVGDKELPLEKNQAQFELPAGKHTLTLAWDHTVRTAPFLQADLYEPTAKAAHVQPVGGP
jgi:putative heme-binding domain-containing protein